VKNRKHRAALVALILVLVAATAWVKREYIEELPIGCAFKAKALCAGLFVQGLPAETIEREDSGFDPAFGLIKARVDAARRSVTCSLLGLGLFSKTAVYIEGLGPVLLSGRSEASLRALAPPPEAAPAADGAGLAWPAGDAEPRGRLPSLDSGALGAAVDEVFAERDPAHLKRTRAVLVVYEGRIVAERYAKGIARDTRLLSWSMAKSFTNAMIGILAREGKLDIHAPAPVPEWKGTKDPRGAITTDMLMRMSSGLAWEEDYTDHPVSDSNRMLFLEPDAAAFAASKPLAAAPDSRWSYSSGTTNIVSRIARDVIGSEAGYLAFPRKELFDRIGMRSAVFGVDSAGTLIGSSYLYATARDYARFGLLCLNDGTWLGERILPELWMAYSTTPTPAAPKGGYGAFFWLNRGSAGNAMDREYPDMPTDLFWADGYQGQQIFVCPSLRLVAVRLGMAWNSDWGSGAFLRGLRKAIGK
jgi:CubicO group peptidase (beta-lactamase class C family)